MKPLIISLVVGLGIVFVKRITFLFSFESRSSLFLIFKCKSSHSKGLDFESKLEIGALTLLLSYIDKTDA